MKTLLAENKRINKERLEDIVRLKDKLKQSRDNLLATSAKKQAIAESAAKNRENKLEQLVESGVTQMTAEDQLRKEQNNLLRTKKRER